MKKLLSTLSLSTTLLLLAAKNIFAQVNISNLTYPGQKIQNNFNIADLLTKGGFNILTFVFFLAGLFFFFSLISAAWEYLMSQGDQKKFSSATTRFLNAFVGIVIVLGSFVIVRVILAILNIQSTF